MFPQRPNQLIVNEYMPGQGIHAHIDRDLFEDGIVATSLLSNIRYLRLGPEPHRPHERY